MDSPTSGAASPTYQCVVCQSTCLTPNELHRHQSYRHTAEELSLSIIGVHNAAIRTFDLPNGIVYDNSWLYDPNRHAQFYTYSANMLCDDNNNGGVVDYAFKAFKDRVVEESGAVAVPDDDCTHDLDQCIGEKYENYYFVEAQNFEQESSLGESKILDLRLKIDLEVEGEIRMDTAKDNFLGSGEGHSGDTENLGKEDDKSASSETCVKSLNSEKPQTCVLDGLASKILDLGRKVFLETRADTAADDLGNCYEGLQSCGDSGNLGRDVVEKSKDPQIETCVKVQNVEEPQSCVQESEILDLSQKFCSEVQSGTPLDAVADNFGKPCEDVGSEVGNLRGETAKRRLSPGKIPVKSKARKLTVPRKKPDGPKREAAKPENTENRESGNVDSVKQGSQDSLSWFESEASKIEKFNDKVKQIRAGQKKALDLTKLAQKKVKVGGCAKAKKRTMQSCGGGDSVWLSRNFDSEDLLGFDVKGATINATSSRNVKRSRVSRKKGKICELEADKAAEETAELPKKPFGEETSGETGLFGSDQSLFKFKRTKSQIHAPTVGKAKKPRVTWKKENISETKANNSAELQKKQSEEETTGETKITVHSAEHCSLIGSDQLLFNLKSGKSKVHVMISGNAKKPRVSKKKGKINETEAENSADLQKKQLEEESAGESKIAVHNAEHGSIIGSDQSLFDSGSSKSKIHATSSRPTKKTRVSKKKEKVSETEADNSADETAELLKKLFEEETAGETLITQNQENGNGNSAEHCSIFTSDKYSSHFERKRSKVHATTSGNAKKPRVSRKRGNISETEADNSAEETAELLRNLLGEETAGETQITQNQDNGNGNRAERSSIFASAESTFQFVGKEPKIDVPSSVNAENPIASKRTTQNLETAAESKRESTKPADQNCEQEIGFRPNWDCKSEDSPACLDTERPNINAMRAENAGAQAEITVADKPAKHESIEEIENGVDQNCEKEAGLRANWDFKSDFPACLDAGRPNINAMRAENAGAQAEITVADKPAKHESIEEIENGVDQNCEKEVGLQVNWNVVSEDFPVCLDADGPKTKAMCVENAGAQADKSVADKRAEEESIEEIKKGKNQNCAKEAGLQPNWDFESPDCLACSDGDGQKIKAMCAENAGAQVKKSVPDKPAEQEYIVEIKTGVDQICAKEAGLQPNWDFESPDCLACSDGDGQKIKAMCAENAGAQVKKSVPDKPAEPEYIVEIKTGVDQNCAKEAGLQPNWDVETPDFRTCSDGDGQKINATHTENAGTQTENTGTQTENTAVESTAELPRDLLTEPSEEEIPPGTEKLKNQDYENGNRAEQSSIFGSVESTIRFDLKEAKIDAFASGSAKRPIASQKKARKSKTVADKSTEQETPKPANQNCAKEVDEPNWDFESADFLARTDGDGQKINATCAENAGTQTENTAVESTAELLRDLLTEPSEEEIRSGTEKLKNQDYENGNRAEQSSIFGFAESPIRFDSKKAKIDAFPSGSAKRPIASKEKARNPKTVADKSTERETPKPANQNYAQEVRPQPNWDFESADFLARTENAGAQAAKAAVEVTAELLRDLLSQPSEEETPGTTEKFQNEDFGNEDYAEHDSVFSSDEYLYYFPSAEARMAAMYSGCSKKPMGSGKKTSDLKPVTVWPAKQKMTRKIVNDGNGNLSKQSSGSSRDVFSYMGNNIEEATVAPQIASGKKSSHLKPVTVWPAKQKMSRKIAIDGHGNSSKQRSGSSRYVFSSTGSESEEATVAPPVASGKKSDNLKTLTVWTAKQKTTRKIVNDGDGDSSKQSSCTTRDVFSYTGSESEEATITPLSKFRAERSSALGKKPKINAGDENCAGRNSNFVPNIYTCADRATKVETLNSFGKKPRKLNQVVENCAERNSNFVPNIYTCTDRASKQVEIKAASAEKPKRRQSKKSKNSERVSDKTVAKKAARGTTKLFYQNFGTEMFASQNSPPIIDVNSSTESGSEEAMPGSSSAGNVGKSVVARSKPKNLQTPEVEAAPRESNENPEHDNVISLYKDSSPVPGGSAACDNELPPVTFVAYPPYVDENSILVLNPESRELVWRCLDTENSQLDETANFHWFERGSHQDFSETEATTSRNVDNEKSTLQSVRRSTRPRKVIQRYNP